MFDFPFPTRDTSFSKMTEFSQSLQLGNNTLDALERQLSKPQFTPSSSIVGRRVTRSSQSKPTGRQSSSEDVVEDSPTNVKGLTAELSRHRSARERLQSVSTQSRSRRTGKPSAGLRRANKETGQQIPDKASENVPPSTHYSYSNTPGQDRYIASQEICGGQKTHSQHRALKRTQSNLPEHGAEGPSPEKLLLQSSNHVYEELFQSSNFSVDAPRSQSLPPTQSNGSYRTLFDESDFTLDKDGQGIAHERSSDAGRSSAPDTAFSAISENTFTPEIFSETIFDRAITSDEMVTEAEENTGLEESLRVAESAEDSLEDVMLNIENVTFSQPLESMTARSHCEAADPLRSSDVLDWIEPAKTSHQGCDALEETLSNIRELNDSDVVLHAPPISQKEAVQKNLEVAGSNMSFDASKDLRLLASWGLPSVVTAEYGKKGIVELFPWQVECLSRREVLLEGKNLVYSAPTSAGKTLVSEFLMAKTIAERKLKVLLILPFVAVAREKMLYLRDLLAPCGMRVEGFYGGYHPPGGFDSVDLAVCTIEKANSIVNRLLEQSRLASLGLVVVDEAHLISDHSRGYILELLLTKIRFVAQKSDHRVQIVCMSATLPNIDLLARWLEADLFHTDFRPIELVEMVKIGSTVYGAEKCAHPIRHLDGTLLGCPIPNDPDHVTLLCLETILEGCSVIVFCPSKDWCEKLALSLASTLHDLRNSCQRSAGELGEKISAQFETGRQEEVLLQLRNCPAGLDSVLARTVRYGVAFHHAGLTTDERDIIEGSFRDGTGLRVIVATSTLSSGVNLPARRVIVRTPKFGGRQMSALTYKQMIGRAGRKGRDTLGESVLICAPTEEKMGRELMRTELPPVRSCLDNDHYCHLKRAVLEIVASGSASTTQELESFVNMTLYSCERNYCFEVNDQLLLQWKQQARTRLKATSADCAEGDGEEGRSDPIASCIAFLLEYEFIRLQEGSGEGTANESGTGKLMHLFATRLGQACLAASLPPKDGFLLFSELQKARQCFVLESELHAVYLVTPYSVAYQWQQIDWMDFLDLWEKLPMASRRVGELVGVKESFMVRAMRGTGNLDYRALQVHKRFYTALALLELVHEVPLGVVAKRFKCCRGLLQSLQQTAATFAGIVASFCRALRWTLVELIVGQFRERLFFGVAHELLDLMRIPSLNGQRARLLYDGGITTLTELANADRLAVEQIIYNRTSFEAERLRDDENEFDAARRKRLRNLYLTGRAGVTVEEAAQLLIQEARTFLQLEHGLENPNWSTVAAPADMNRSAAAMAPFAEPLKPDRQRKEQEQDQSISSVLSREDTSAIGGQFHNSLLMASDSHSRERAIDTPAAAANRLRIVDVCRDRFLYEQFLHTLSEYGDCLTIALGVARDESVPPSVAEGLQIGGQLLRKLPPAAEQFYDRPAAGNKRAFAFDDSALYLDGVAFTGGSTGEERSANGNAAVFYLNLQDNTVVGEEEKRQLLRSLLQNDKRTITFLDAKDQLKVAYRAGLLRDGGAWEEVLAAIQDPRVACWLLQTEEKTLTMEAMVARHCPELARAELDWTGQRWVCPKWTGHGMNYHSPMEARIRCAVECRLVHRLMAAVHERLRAAGGESLLSCFVSREMPVQVALARAEVDGFPADRRLLGALIARLKACRDRLAEDARKLNGNRRLDFGSSRAVAAALRLASAGDGRGRIRTVRQVLERLDSPLAALVIAHRKIESNLSRTIEPLHRAICPRTGRIHGRSYCFTSTGRITMHEPNLQTVVKDFDVPGPPECGETRPAAERYSCRSTFACASPDVVLLSADFCQLELCILTHLSQDRQLMDALGGAGGAAPGSSGRDVFRSIAARWNALERESDVSDELRNRTKAIVYGVIYGMGVRSMAAELQVDEDAARSLVQQFHATYPGIRRYTERVVRLTRQLGYIETLTGRRRHLTAINSADPAERAEAERQAVCTTIQGSAADILKNAIVRMVRNLRRYRDVLDLGAIRLVLHLHDELIYEVPRAQLPKVAKILRLSMENCAKLSVPLRVKLKAGSSWGTLEELKQ